MSSLNTRAQPEGVKVVLAGNIDFLKYLQRKYGKHATIQQIINKENPK